MRTRPVTETEIDRLLAEYVPGEPCPLCGGDDEYSTSPSGNCHDPRETKHACPVCAIRRRDLELSREDEDARKLSGYFEQIDAIVPPEFATREAKAKFLAVRIGIIQVFDQVVGGVKKGRAA